MKILNIKKNGKQQIKNDKQIFLSNFIALFILCLLGFSFEVFGAIKIKDINIADQKEDTISLSLKFDGNLESAPELLLKDHIIQLVINGASVWPKIEKRVTLGNDKQDTTLLAYQFEKNLVRFRVITNFEVKEIEEKINVSVKDNEILVKFPVVAKSGKDSENTVVGNAQTKEEVPPQSERAILKYDEKYLETLLQEKETKSEKNKNKLQAKDIKEDEVKMRSSSLQQKVQSNQETLKGSSNFSFMGLITKFVAFLGLILLGFYSLVVLVKKGVIKKGRLGFLNDTKIVSVLNTTYIAPKKSLLLVQVHNQVFFLGSDDKGIHFLSEVNDVAGLLKNGEKQVAGNNFDTNLNDISTTTAKAGLSKEFKLKDDIHSSSEQVTTGIAGGIKDDLMSLITGSETTVKLSDQIKKKMKNLKPLQ